MDHHLRLSDGRNLAYAEYGDPAGIPVIYFHGAPSGRLEPTLIGDDTWTALGLRIIAPDRPGIGGSTSQPARRLIDWPSDVMALAEHLGLSTFSLLGNSGGAPYVAACASVFPERLRTAVIVSGAWQMSLPEARAGLPLPNRLAFWLARRAPALLGLLLGTMAKSTPTDMEKEREQLKARVPAADYEAFLVPGRIEAFSACLQDALSPGARGAALDMGLITRPFGFEPSDVGVPITWFHGERDANVPIGLARLAVAALPGAQLVSYPEDAHLSTLCTHIDAIAQALRANSRQTA